MLGIPNARLFPFLGAAVVLGMVVAACGGGEATATPPPAPTSTRAVPTPTTPAPSPTSVPATPTSAPTAIPVAATATPVPAQGVPTPVVLQGKRGGTLQLHALPGEPYGIDTFTTGSPSAASHEIWAAMLNNLIQIEPYSDGKTLVGDVAQRWDIGAQGNVITFSLRQGIKYHDGTPLTAKDVAYNVERARKPRSPTMAYFRSRVSAIDKVETPDDFTVRLTLSTPSNSLMRILSMNQFLMYPSHLPFPEKEDEYKKNPIGSGPFKFKNLDPSVKLEYARNDNYWKAGLPYLDAVVINFMGGQTLISAFRTGKVDATNFAIELTPSVLKTVEREQKFNSTQVIRALAFLHLNQRPPWTDQRAREAVSLALDRQALLTSWLDGQGDTGASPLMPPELGGQWGVSTEALKSRPGFRADKTADIARAKTLLTQAGVDPAQTTLDLVTSTTYQLFGELVDASLRALGFKTNLRVLPANETTAIVMRGDFSVYFITTAVTFDDPADYLLDWVLSTGSQNYAKWSIPRLDSLLKEQDSVVDTEKRKQMLAEAQSIILDQYHGAMIPADYIYTTIGSMSWVKNFYQNIRSVMGPRFRWEQVYLER